MNLKEACEQIYKAYPRHIGKRPAIKAIMNALTRLHDGEWEGPMSWAAAVFYLQDYVEMFANSPAGKRGQYTPHPATWFNQSRYLDDPKEWNVTATEHNEGVKHGWLQ